MKNMKGRNSELGKHSCGLKDNIKMCLKTALWKNTVCIYVAQDTAQWRTVTDMQISIRFREREGNF
jgi:hypothetical protein